MNLANKVKQFSNDADLINLVVNGDKNTEIEIAGEKIKSVSKLIKDNDISINASGLLSNVNSARDEAVTARKMAESACDTAQLSAKLFNDINTGLAATLKNSFFSVLSSDNSELMILYKNKDGVAQEEKRYPSVNLLKKTGSSLKSILFNGQLDNAGEGLKWILGDSGPTIITTTTPFFNQLGINYVGILNSATRYLKVTPNRQFRADSYFAASLLIESPSADFSWIGLTNFRVWVIGTGGGTEQAAFAMNDFVQLTNTIRVYRGVFQVPKSIQIIDHLFFGFYGSATIAANITGFALALSESLPFGVDWGDFDPFGATKTATRLAALEKSQFDYLALRTSIKSIVPNGGLEPAGAALSWVMGSTAPPISAITNTTINALGINYAAIFDSTTRYLKVQFTRQYVAGNHIAASLIVESADGDFSWVTPTSFRFWIYGNIDSQQMTVSMTDFLQLSPTVRVYRATAKIPANVPVLGYCFFGVAGTSTKTVRVTGFAMAASETVIAGVDWADVDPYKTNSQERRLGDLNTRIAAAEARLVKLDTTSVATSWLFPSSFFTILGRPLTLHRSGMSDQRDATPHILAFAGEAAGRPQIAYVGDTIDLDGSRISGNAAVWIRRRDDSLNIQKRPISVFVSPAQKNKVVKILSIGDSLTYQGTVSALNEKLVAAGVTPQFVGTFKEINGLMTEGRSSWRASNYIWQETAVNGDGSGALLPVSDDSAYLKLDPALAFAGRWAFNPFIRPATISDSVEIVRNGFVFDMRAYLNRFNIPTPDIVTIALGTNDHANNPLPTCTNNCIDALTIMYQQIRAALPAAKIAIILNGAPLDVNFNKLIPFYKAVLNKFSGREAENVFVLPIYMAQDPKFIYGINTQSTDSTGVQIGTVKDWVHSDAIGRSQWSEMTFAFVMNQI